jgi:hypothetical protein
LPFLKIFESNRGFINYFLKYHRGAIYILPYVLIVVLLGLSGIVRLTWQLIVWPFTSKRSSSENR